MSNGVAPPFLDGNTGLLLGNEIRGFNDFKLL